ncbi:MAG: hypothetical protein ABSG33_09750 [Candidatus Bathyarchaeia archaeon]|jgi:hypothetical protein
MGFQPRTQPHREASRKYIKPLREKGKSRKARGTRAGRSKQELRRVPTAKEVSEGTLKRLHTLGSQKFGSSPFSQHFDRWLTTVKAVLSEFESNPNVGVDDQFLGERTQILSSIERQLENKRRVEAALDEEERNLAERRNHFEQIKREYVIAATETGKRRNREIKRLRSGIERLKRAQDEVIRMKTGFFRGVSRKERERKEIEITQKLADAQRLLELATLNFKVEKVKLREEYEKKSAPVVDEMKKFQKKLDDGETDDSLEDRWFACEALIDAVNNFLQRKSALTDPQP